MNKIKTDFFFYGTLPDGKLVGVYYKITQDDIDKGHVQEMTPYMIGSSVDEIKTKLSTNLTPTYQGQVSSVDRMWLATKSQINQYLIALKKLKKSLLKKGKLNLMKKNYFNALVLKKGSTNLKY